MSVERDLLGRWHNGDLLPEEYMKLMKETKQLLNQPEEEQEVYSKGYAEAMQQLVYEAYESGRKSALSEQDPVAWCQLVDGKVQDLLTSFEMKDWLYDKSWIPLYASPPKREPIEDEELEVWYSQHAWAMDKQEYMWGFRDAEKCHGIGVDDE